MYVFKGRPGLTPEEIEHDAELARARCNDCKYRRDSIGHKIECASPRPRPWQRKSPASSPGTDG